jgi:hypothetical protein
MDKMTSNQYVAGQKRIYGVIKQWNQTCADYAEMGVDVLKLLAHPDTELSEAMQAWDMYRESSKRIHLMRSDLEARYPDYDFKI